MSSLQGRLDGDITADHMVPHLGFMSDQHLDDIIVSSLRRQVERREQAEGDMSHDQSIIS